MVWANAFIAEKLLAGQSAIPAALLFSLKGYL
jgi:hypothetical protein